MYKKLMAFVNTKVWKCKSTYYSDLIEKNKAIPSNLWKTIKEVTGGKSSSPISCLISRPKSIADALNVYFETIGIKLAIAKQEKFGSFGGTFSCGKKPNKPCATKFSFQSTDKNYVKDQLQTLKTNKAIGLDRISARLLKDSVLLSLDFLTVLYTKDHFP